MYEQLIGHRLDRYQLVQLIRQENAGVVFRGQDLSVQRLVTVKVLSSSIVGRPDFDDRFARVAQVARRLDHPNIIKLLDFGQASGYYYLVFEQFLGDSLEERLRQLRSGGSWIRLGEAAHLVRQLALGVDYLTDQEWRLSMIYPAGIHIKPSQSETLPYIPVIGDLGLVSMLRLGVSLAEEIPAGAYPYLSPERSLGSNSDSRSYVYSLGVILYELATGQTPFPIESLDDAVRYHTRQPLPSPRSIRPDLPESLEQVILHALYKNPEDRFPNAKDFARSLAAIIPTIETIATPPPAYERVASLVADSPQAPIPEPRPSSYEAANAQQLASSQNPEDEVEIIIENPQLAVEPGNKASTDVILINNSQASTYYRCSMDGIPETWAFITPPVLQLRPGEQARVEVVIQPPRTPESRAGRYPLTFRVSSQQTPARFVEASATLTVGAFSRFSSDLRTLTLMPAETGQVTVTNQGNTPDTFNLHFSDPENELAFNPPGSQLRLAEGQSGIAEFTTSLRQPRWIGGERTHPFRIQVISTTGEAQTHSGEFTSRSLVPTWFIGLLLFLCLCLAGSSLFFVNRQGAAVSRATATFLAERTGTALAIQGTSQAETATAAFLANANQATIEAVTATAAWLARDDDSDGLTNQREIELGTVSSDPDTDDDGLSDGDEVTRTTDPLNPDTDGDGLKDGDEVRMNLDPLNPDTDGDGIPDSQDQAPLQTSTRAPDQGATQNAIQTQTQAAHIAETARAATLTAQAGSNTAGTAQALTQTAQAQTQIAQAQTQTAQAGTIVAGTALAGTQTAQALTQTAAAIPRALFIHRDDQSAAQAYQSILAENGIPMDLIHQDQIQNVNLGLYKIILIGHDTGNEATWGDEGGSQANRINQSGLPILGIGRGGFAYFGRLGLEIGWDNGVAGNGTDIVVVDPANPIWTTPNQIEIPDDQVITLYNRVVEFVAATFETPPANVTPVGQQPDNPNNFPLVRRNERYFLWGFSAHPNDLTETGRQILVNLVTELMP